MTHEKQPSFELEGLTFFYHPLFQAWYALKQDRNRPVSVIRALKPGREGRSTWEPIGVESAPHLVTWLLEQ